MINMYELHNFIKHAKTSEEHFLVLKDLEEESNIRVNLIRKKYTKARESCSGSSGYVRTYLSFLEGRYRNYSYSGDLDYYASSSHPNH